MDVSFVVISGPDEGSTFRLLGDRLVIGSRQPADVVLHDAEVAIQHCEIRRHGGAGSEVDILDLGTGQGTFVDGVGVTSARLRCGQTLALGESRLQLVGPPRTQPMQRGAAPERRLVGRSMPMAAAVAVLERAAPTDVTVLIEGETGTGKESAAEHLHRRSARSAGPFVVVDCGSIPSALLESELFGHERGSFTGAVTSRQGAFELAEGGTVFLDEVGELAAELQPKLLRVLERRQVKRVGAGFYQPVDVRLVAATSRDLRDEVQRGRFRKDLFYRLAVVQVHMPPLRDRTVDLPLLIDHMLAELGATEHPEAAVLRSRRFQGELARHSWPGNVRELRNYLERCLTFGPVPIPREAPSSSLPQLDEDIDTTQPLKAARDQLMRRFETAYLKAILLRHDANVSAAARAAGVDRITFYRMLDRNGLR